MSTKLFTDVTLMQKLPALYEVLNVVSNRFLLLTFIVKVGSPKTRLVLVLVLS